MQVHPATILAYSILIVMKSVILFKAKLLFCFKSVKAKINYFRASSVRGRAVANFTSENKNLQGSVNFSIFTEKRHLPELRNIFPLNLIEISVEMKSRDLFNPWPSFVSYNRFRSTRSLISPPRTIF